jgi:nicotinamide-nucleotide amidase
MQAVVLSIGSELLQGFLTDTNATYLTQELSGLGVEVVGVMQVDDNLERVVRAFSRAIDDADLVISTGGIGPTDDDLTREAVAAIVGETPVVDDAIAATIREFFTRRGIVMPEQNVKQAWVIPSCEVLPNPVGTAPGWFVSAGDCSIVSMPGVPREMFRMWSDEAVPRILRRLGTDTIIARTLKTIGLGESAVEQELKPMIDRGFPTIATYAKDDGVHVRITAVSSDRASAKAAVERAERDIRGAIGMYVYGELDTPLASAVLDPIARSCARLSVWEAGNAGRLASLLADSPLADQVLASCVSVSGGAFSFDGDATPSSLAASGAQQAALTDGVDYGAAVVVRVLESGGRDRQNGEIALALAHPGGVAIRTQTIMSNPSEIRRRATLSAAEFLWTTLRDGSTSPLE